MQEIYFICGRAKMMTALPDTKSRRTDMGEISFSNHISNKKSAINSKAKLAGVAKPFETAGISAKF